MKRIIKFVGGYYPEIVMQKALKSEVKGKKIISFKLYISTIVESTKKDEINYT